ncbi:sodium:solute symporter family transporter [Pedobacter cryophilus]|uniref:Sodium:solute symporter n=1 Tax=Pedobacter cryophilus TaxID=2571271 RepID=A0A4U1BV75_9SPHI|nr:sodium:solute symporter [Pedobacter cryophilus]TKB96689.1 sodium:solute symporter [Pedobacter cryophilus]
MENSTVIILQWSFIILSSVLIFALAPLAKTTKDFFYGTKNDKQPNALLLTSSLVISWIFAKSITNVANLGLSFGLVGVFSYAAYYLSFLVAGLVIYKMRINGGFKSIHHFIGSKYGKGALYLFSILIAFRLFNEVWSNTMVIGTYFGDAGSTPYYVSIVVFTLLTLAYALKGGMSTSILTDVIQMLLFGVLLTSILSFILPEMKGDLKPIYQSGTWSMATGGNLILVALLQCFSYPFHDPVLTDRGFITSPKVTLKSFIWATVIGVLCISLFGIVGIFAQSKGMSGQATVEVAKFFGPVMLLIMNFIMVTSAASTLDSAFSSFSKLYNIDIFPHKELKISKGRLSMVALTILGTIPIFFKPEILSATTISGTMVIGLAPIFLFWNKNMPKFSFYAPVIFGLLMGLLIVFEWVPKTWIFTDGKYNDLLGVNLWGSLICFILFFIPQTNKLWQKS